MKNESAFPVTPDGLTTNSPIDGGLTKREYFTAMILQGFIQSDKYDELSDEDYIKRSLHMADELLTQLEKPCN